MQIQPTIRRDSNYHDLDSVKKLAVWDDEYQRWKIPELAIIKTKLPPAGELLNYVIPIANKCISVGYVVPDYKNSLNQATPDSLYQQKHT